MHVVQKGEWLSKISKKYYGTHKKWRKIYRENKGVIGKNPNLIRPGQKLVITFKKNDPVKEEKGGLDQVPKPELTPSEKKAKAAKAKRPAQTTEENGTPTEGDIQKNTFWWF